MPPTPACWSSPTAAPTRRSRPTTPRWPALPRSGCCWSPGASARSPPSAPTVPSPLMCAVVAPAAAVGDSVGSEIGARSGTRLLSIRVLRRRADRIDAARATLARRGGPAVFGGRFVAFLRAVMPFLAGTSHMHYPRFLAYNAAGGLTWGIGSVVLGYLAGNSYTALGHTFGRATALI